MRSVPLLAAACSVAFGASLATAQITNGQIDTFQDGTVMDWGNGIVDFLVTNEDGGPAGAGDRYLEVATIGDSVGPGSRLGVFNREQWTGDYLAAGVDTITMDVANFTPSTDIELRLMLFTDVGSVFTTTLSAAVANDGAWTSVSFDISEAGMTRVEGSFSYEDSMNAVNRLLVRHQPGAPGSVGGAPALLDGLMGLDNIRALPAPGGVAVLALGGLLAGRRRR